MDDVLPIALRQRAIRHLDALAREHGITVKCSRTWRTSEAYLVTRQVFVPDIRTGTDYLAALHEIGHLVDAAAKSHSRRYNTSSGRASTYERMIEEAAAWAWAVKTAKPSVLRAMTKADWRRVGLCWASYAGDVF